MFDADQILFDHACATMPDSLVRRKAVLQALLVKVNAHHPAFALVSSQLAAIEIIEKNQADLQAKLPLPKPVARNSKNCNGK